MKALLPKLTARLREFTDKARQLDVPEFKNEVVEDEDEPIRCNGGLNPCFKKLVDT